MTDAPRTKSPRAPTMALDEAIERTLEVYKRIRLHTAPTDLMAQHLGYKGTSSGTALAALASLRYYGLLERPSSGMLAVSKEFEFFDIAAPGVADLKRSYLFMFLRRPALFAELLDKYASGLPPNEELQADLVQRGFLPATAASVVSAFRRSTEFAGYFGHANEGSIPELAASENPGTDESTTPKVSSTDRPAFNIPASQATDERDYDKIPVRLSGGRRAWLAIPTPFYEADKLRLKAQIDLLLTAEDGA